MRFTSCSACREVLLRRFIWSDLSSKEWLLTACRFKFEALQTGTPSVVNNNVSRPTKSVVALNTQIARCQAQAEALFALSALITR